MKRKRIILIKPICPKCGGRCEINLHNSLPIKVKQVMCKKCGYADAFRITEEVYLDRLNQLYDITDWVEVTDTLPNGVEKIIESKPYKWGDKDD